MGQQMATTLISQKIRIHWEIEDFDVQCAVATALYGEDCKNDLQFELPVQKQPYISKNAMQVTNKWEFFLKKPQEGNFFSVGMTRNVLNYHEGIESEAPFGIAVSFKLECPGTQPAQIFSVDSDIFQLKHGESREWEVPTLSTSAGERHVTVNGTLEIIPLPWNQPDVAKDEEAARRKDCVLKVSKDIGAFYSKDNAPFSDFTIKVVDGEDEETFPVHKCIIAARSPVWRRMLENPMFNETREGITTIHDVSPAAMHHFLKFLYSAELSLSEDFDDIFESGEIIMDLVYAADKYEVPALKDLCDQQLPKFFNFKNAYRMFDLCENHCLKTSAPVIENFIEFYLLSILEEKKKATEESRK